jgi:hypothetical protein
MHGSIYIPLSVLYRNVQVYGPNELQVAGLQI